MAQTPREYISAWRAQGYGDARPGGAARCTLPSKARSTWRRLANSGRRPDRRGARTVDRRLLHVAAER